jgi:hypothetical protein
MKATTQSLMAKAGALDMVKRTLTCIKVTQSTVRAD